jgi:DNA-binding NarL/FixJ family response regulator
VSDRLIKLLLIDDDPIFRLGLITALAPFCDLQVIAQAESPAAAFRLLIDRSPDLIVLEPAMPSMAEEGWQLCQQLKQRYPSLPICLLTTICDPQRLTAARAVGVEGYCRKGVAIEDLASILRQIASGETNWQALAVTAAPSSLLPQAQWLTRLHQSGLEQIDESLSQVNRQLKQSPLPLLDRLFWQGRRRELLAARWLVNQLLPGQVLIVPQPPQPQPEPQRQLPESEGVALTFSPSLSKAAIPFNNTLARLELGVENLTGIPLEIDILQPDKKRELLYLVLNHLKKSLEELQFLGITVEQLPEEIPMSLRKVWQSSSLDFLGKYYSYKNQSAAEALLKILLEYAQIVQQEIIKKIPLVDNLFTHFLFDETLLIDGVEYRSEAPEVIARAELLLQNLIVQIGNAVIAFTLNNFSDLEDLKKVLYDKSMLSSREMARFRNDLSWRYRQEKYWGEPKNIFESKYRLFFLNGKSVRTLFIYAPRQEELQRLRGIPWLVTIALETRDAIAPRLRTVFSWLGKGLVYLLTQVIGRGLGLIGRGILQGIGNTFQEARYGKNSGAGK